MTSLFWWENVLNNEQREQLILDYGIMGASDYDIQEIFESEKLKGNVRKLKLNKFMQVADIRNLPSEEVIAINVFDNVLIGRLFPQKDKIICENEHEILENVHYYVKVSDFIK